MVIASFKGSAGFGVPHPAAWHRVVASKPRDEVLRIPRMTVQGLFSKSLLTSQSYCLIFDFSDKSSEWRPHGAHAARCNRRRIGGAASALGPGCFAYPPPGGGAVSRRQNRPIRNGAKAARTLGRQGL